MPTNTAVKTLVKIPEIIEMYRKGMSQKDIAEHYGVRRETIRDMHNRPEFQSYLWQIANTTLQSFLDDMEKMSESDSPQDRRVAFQEKGKMFGRLFGKLLPSQVHQTSETTHITISPSDLAWRQFYDILCPDCQRAVIEYVNKDLPSTPRYVETESRTVE